MWEILISFGKAVLTGKREVGALENSSEVGTAEEKHSLILMPPENKVEKRIVEKQE